MQSYSEDRSVLDLVGREPDSTLSYGQLPDQVIDLYSGKEAGLPLIVLIHGGYWRSEFDRKHLRPFAAALAESGWQVALIEYQRISGQPYLASSDVESAIRFSIAEIPHQGGSVTLMGHSAGGHLAMWAASRIPHLKRVIALAPIADLRAGESLNLDNGAIQSFLGAPALERSDLDPAQITTLGNPITIIHGAADTIVPIELSEGYVNSKSGAVVTFIKLLGIGHFELIDSRSSVWEIIQRELKVN